MAERISLLVTVKAYPAISEKYGEVVCVAGIRTDTPQPEWARLYPVAFRDLPFAQRFKKYHHISLEASKHGSDKRPETYRPNLDTLEVGEILDTKRAWEARRRFVEPLTVDSMCATLRRQEQEGTSLAAFRPAEVLDLLIDDEADDWTPTRRTSSRSRASSSPRRMGSRRSPTASATSTAARRLAAAGTSSR